MNLDCVSIKDASILLGVTPKTIRLWDKKNLIETTRTTGNQRRISIKEIERLRDKIKDTNYLTNQSDTINQVLTQTSSKIEEVINKDFKNLIIPHTLEKYLSNADKEYIKTKIELAKREELKMLPIRKWVTSEFHLGAYAGKVTEYWIKILEEIFEYNNNKDELLLGGSIGTNRSSFCILGILRQLYELSCIKGKLSDIFKIQASNYLIGILGVSEYYTYTTNIINSIRQVVSSIEYFKKNYMFNENIQRVLLFPDNVIITPIITHDDVDNNFLSIFCDTNFISVGSPDVINKTARILELYNLTLNNLITRKYSIMPIKNTAWLVMRGIGEKDSHFSFKRYFELRLNKGTGLNFQRTYLYEPRLWDIHPENSINVEKVYVYLNDEKYPVILENYEDLVKWGKLTIEEEKLINSKLSLKVNICAINRIKCKCYELPAPYKSLFNGDNKSIFQDLFGSWSSYFKKDKK